ncbi:MAG: carbon-nitrogen hydrolase family protein [Anaerolineae bacterium]|jgi:apolipoprotein N-acyltransferase|nr:carbon-nitrogen hydrolase family protein [Anaerolineae bacterium]MBT7783588.1 carbon-nitrogen hydrolase family protein [Anaerolineae bacterium]
MNSKTKNFLYLAIYAALTLFIGGRYNFPLAAWIAPIFALHFYRNTEKAGRNFLLLWLATAVPTMIAWKGATAMGFLHPLAEPLFFTLTMPISLIPLVIDRLYHRRWSASFLLTLVYPISVTAIDFFNASGSPFGTFGAGAYSQAGFTPLLQITAFTGMWAIPFIVSWFSSMIAYFWENDFSWTKIRKHAWILAGMLTLIIGFGLGRTLLSSPPAQEVKIAGFSLPAEEFHTIMELMQTGEQTAFRATTLDSNARQLAHVRELAQAGAEIVVLQEGAGIGFPEEIEILLEDATKLAQEEGIYIVLPSATIFPEGDEPFHNVVRIIDPTGEIVLEHYKYGGTQFEGSLAGSGEIQTVDTPYGKLSAVICWDADFPSTIKQAGEKGVDLLFVPSNDWYEIRDIHADMATFRSIENGMPIYRQTGAGISTVTDAYGQIINSVNIFEEESTSAWGGEQMVMVPVGSVETAFPKIGDAFGQAMLIALLGLIGFGWMKRK